MAERTEGCLALYCCGREIPCYASRKSLGIEDPPASPAVPEVVPTAMKRTLVLRPPNIWNTPEHQEKCDAIFEMSLEDLVESALGRRSAHPRDVLAALRLTAVKAEDRGNSYQHLNEDAGEAHYIEVMKNGALTRDTHDLRARLAFAESRLEEWQEREAKVCPEDFSFEEVIAKLRATVSALKEDAERLDWLEIPANWRFVATLGRIYYGPALNHGGRTVVEGWNGYDANGIFVLGQTSLREAIDRARSTTALAPHRPPTQENAE